MYTLLAVLVYAAAVVVPACLLLRFHSQAWPWHLLAVAAGLAIGLTPIPPALQTQSFDLLFGFVFLFLICWGLGGLLLRPHRHRHA